ncbi:hypothetical protein F8388_017304 [Cannabis sativa]|uniref:RNase H type-1 domain-containing protein n=1 Tax=Cannabis sativa TaxID=3483 RepID=A0A7J6FWU3_CANSA|nr:hypothetical protein F8388_017304 [Cannabis sativa]
MYWNKLSRLYQQWAPITHSMTRCFLASGNWGMAAIVFNRSDDSWAVKVQITKAAYVLEAETRAILLALSWAHQSNWSDIHVLSNSQVLMNALAMGRCLPEWACLNPLDHT